VVIAVGFKYFKHLPTEIGQRVPSERILHTFDFVNFDTLHGKRCLTIGGRQSAFEWAALISEAGAAAVHICHRHDSLSFKISDWSWVAPLVDIYYRGPGLVSQTISDQTGRNAPSPVERGPVKGGALA
jgi:cation diffusion facilitator CzcD-associated flavoprotein CzcO